MQQDPTQYPRRILVAVTGMSPQILTETLWAMAVNTNTPFFPTEIRLFTTSTGKDRAQLSLLSEKPGWFHQMRADYNLPPIAFSREHIEVICNEAGQPMTDIRTVEDNEAAATFLTERIRQLTEDDESALHVSLAGGRKTMGYYIGYAMSLYGRPQDRLSHVLVNSPFEACWDFFYPTPNERIIEIGTGGKKELANCQDARIDLAEIPFVRLRDEIPPRFLSDRFQFSQIVAAANRALQAPILQISQANGSVQADDLEVLLTEVQFVVLCWLAKLHERDMVLCWKESAQEFLRTARQILPEISPIREKLEKSMTENISMYDKDGDAGSIRAYFSPHISHINSKMSEILGKSAAQRYCISSVGPRTQTYFILPTGLEVRWKQ